MAERHTLALKERRQQSEVQLKNELSLKPTLATRANSNYLGANTNNAVAQLQPVYHPKGHRVKPHTDVE